MNPVDVRSRDLFSPVLDGSSAQVKSRKLLKDGDSLVSFHRLDRRGIENRRIAKNPHQGCGSRHCRLFDRFLAVPHGEQDSVVPFGEIKHTVNRLHAHLGNLDVNLARLEILIDEYSVSSADTVSGINLVSIDLHQKHIGIHDRSLITFMTQFPIDRGLIIGFRLGENKMKRNQNKYKSQAQSVHRQK